MRSAPSAYVILVVGLAFPLSHCGDDGSAGTTDVAGSPGRGGQSGRGGDGPAGTAGSSNGGDVGVDAGAGGTTGSSAGSGSAGEPQGGAAGGDGTSGSGTGGACGGVPDPTSCCEAGDPPCPEDWSSNCPMLPATYDCCDADWGVRRSCYHDGDTVFHEDVVCVDECSGKSFGTTNCEECVVGAPACAPDGGCDLFEDDCENESAGYRLNCAMDTQEVVCVCDVDL